MNNTGVIFKRAVRDSRLGILGWGIGMGLMMTMIVMIFPTISSIEGFAKALESPIYKAMLGEAADAAAFLTPEGFIAVYGLVLMPLYLAVYLVLLGIGATAGEEDRGTIDLILSTPVPRWQLVVEKYLALVVIIALVVLLTFVGIALGVILTPEMTIGVGRLIEGGIGMMPIMLVIASIALLAATALRSRMMAGGVAGAIVIASYFVSSLSSIATEALSTVKYLSFFTYYPAMKIMREGIVWGDFLWMLALALILFGLSIVAFQRRDLNV